jgi:hypothetical protein
VGFDVTDQIVVRSFAFVSYSVGKDVLYNILTEFEVPMKIVRLIKMCLNEMYRKVRMGKHVYHSFASECAIRKVHKNQVVLNIKY